MSDLESIIRLCERDFGTVDIDRRGGDPGENSDLAEVAKLRRAVRVRSDRRVL